MTRVPPCSFREPRPLAVLPAPPPRAASRSLDGQDSEGAVAQSGQSRPQFRPGDTWTMFFAVGKTFFFFDRI